MQRFFTQGNPLLVQEKAAFRKQLSKYTFVFKKFLFVCVFSLETKSCV